MSDEDLGPVGSTELDDLAPEERYLVAEAVDDLLDGDEPPNQVESTRVAFLAVHRFGVDLETGAGSYESFEDARDDSARDVRGLASVPVLVPFEELVVGARELVAIAEAEAGWNRYEPGGLVERVDGGESA